MTSTTQSQPTTEANDEGNTKFITYFQCSAAGDKETDLILMDHSYCRPWNWRPETSFVRPTKCLFVHKPASSIKHSSTLPLHTNSSNIDVVDVPATPVPIYDMEKAKTLMEECERHASFARNDEDNDDWEENISKVNWTSSQTRLFSSMVKILNSDRMARLTYAGTWNEPVLRRTIIEKSVQRTRALMASISWDTRLTQWLHNILIDNLSTPYLGAYFDILQTLKSKLPTFVEKMIFGPTAANRVGATSNESLFPLLKRTWDPVASSLIQDKPKKLPGNPVFIIAPSSPSVGPNFSKRLHKWTNLLTSLAHVITVNAHVGIGGRSTNMVSCADQMLASVRSKVQEVRQDCPNRPIVLVGFNTGAALVCQVAEMEPVVAVVCMGFPLLTAEGKRGEPDDILLDLQSPVLFVIGQNSHRTSREDMEDLRERMRVETGLIVVGSADDYLRMRKSKKRSEGITQSIVDRCILDEIGEFVGSILSSPYAGTSRQVTAYGTPGSYPPEHLNKRGKMERIRNNSNGSSIESEPPSPQPKITRPGNNRKSKRSQSSMNYHVGRPPGSGKKKNLFSQFPGTVPVCKSPIDTLPDSSMESCQSSFTDPPEPSTPNETTPTSTGVPPFLIKPEIYRPTGDMYGANIQAIASGSQLQPMAVISNRSILTSGNTLSNLLQKDSGALRTVNTTAGNTTIKVLENIPLTSGTKLFSSGGRTVDLSKVTLVNASASNGGKNPNMSNVVVLSDGTKCLRNNPNVVQSVKTIGSPNMVLPVVQKRQLQMQAGPSSGMTKLVPTRRQITTGKPRSQPTNFPPPTNLTTADILDLPIIFADNDSTLLQASNLEESQPVLVAQRKQPTSKYVVINKQTLVPTSTTPTQPNQLKRPPSSAIRTSSQKFARIIINPNQLQEMDESKRHVLITNQKMKTSENDIITISPKKIESTQSLEFVDLESDLKTNTIAKPMHTTVVSAQTIKNKPDIKNLTNATRNVTMRVPVQVSRSGQPPKPGDPSGSSDNIYLVNNVNNLGRKRSIKTNQDFLKQKPVNYRIENIYEEENPDDPELEK